jgi:hypothetical protein
MPEGGVAALRRGTGSEACAKSRRKETGVRSRAKLFRARRVIGSGGLVALMAIAAWPALAGGAQAGERSALRASNGCGGTVKVSEHEVFVVNRYAQEGMRFVPGTVSVVSGCKLTFSFATPGQSDPHSLSIVDRSDLPRTTAQMESCKVCRHIATRLVAHPNQAPGPANPIVHWIVNAGRPGLDAPGDSIGIVEARGAPRGHRNVTLSVSAPAGSILSFMCGLHPWMQGTIRVT